MTGFKRIERSKQKVFTNEFGNKIRLGVQGGNCTGFGNKNAMLSVGYVMQGPHSVTVQDMTILEAAHLRDALTEMLAHLDQDPTRDKCQMCKGQRGGVPGNENIVHGMTLCDYCHSDIITVERIVRDETLRAAARLACLVAGDMKTFVTSPVAEVLQSVRIKDGKWQSEHAMVLWGYATSRDGEQLHEKYDGNGRERK